MSTAKEKSYEFAKRIVKLSQLLIDARQYAIANQVLRSGTSIGANLEEATGSVSRKEFLVKNAIAFKEAKETHYWLRLICDTGLVEPNLGASLLRDCDELCRMLNSITRSLKQSTPAPDCANP